MYDSILLPYDGSDGTGDVLRHAGTIARWADADVTVLFVADTARDSVTTLESGVVDALVSEGESIVDEAAAVLDQEGVAHETDVVQGDPASAITEYAERYGHDLVVLPSGGRPGLSRRLLGGVTEKVLRLSAVPVLTVRTEGDDELTFPYERVLVPTDGSRASRHAAEHAVALADGLEATLHVLSVVDADVLGPDARPTLAEDEIEAEANEAVERIAADARERDVEVVTHVERGRPDDTILQALEEIDAHLVVMGTTGRRGVERILLGSVAEQTVRAAPVPVLTLASE